MADIPTRSLTECGAVQKQLAGGGCCQVKKPAKVPIKTRRE